MLALVTVTVSGRGCGQVMHTWKNTILAQTLPYQCVPLYTSPTPSFHTLSPPLCLLLFLGGIHGCYLSMLVAVQQHAFCFAACIACYYSFFPAAHCMAAACACLHAHCCTCSGVVIPPRQEQWDSGQNNYYSVLLSGVRCVVGILLPALQLFIQVNSFPSLCLCR